MDWEKYFESDVLARGEDYYKKGRVLEFYEDGRDRTAVVLGTDEYTVHLQFRPDGTLSGMDCSCPYADGGEYCKHMAAALFRNTFGENAGRMRKRASSGTETGKAAELNAYKEKFKNIAAGFKTDGRVDSRYFGECAEYTWIKMKEYADALTAEKRYADAFDITFYALKRICPAAEYSETKKETDALISFAMDIWTPLLEVPSAEKYIFRRLIAYKGGEREYMIRRKTDRFLSEKFARPEYARQLLRHSDDELKEYTFHFSVSGNLDCCLENRLLLLRNLNADEATFAAFREAYWRYGAVQKDYVEECIRSGKFREAERVLLENYGADNFVLFPGYCRQKLAAIYYETGEDDKYARILFDSVTAGRFDMAKFRELKELYTEEEWPDVRERVFATVRDRDFLPEMYAAEQLYDRLLRCVRDPQDIWILNRYFGALAEACPERLLRKCGEILRGAVALGNAFYNYDGLAKILRKLPRVPGGRELAAELSREWREKYKRRRNLMAMLDRIITE